MSKYKIDIVEENLPGIIKMLLTKGKAHPKYFKDLEELVFDLLFFFQISGREIVFFYKTYNCFIEYLRQALLPKTFRISSRVPYWFQYFIVDIPFIGRDYYVPECFRRSVFYHPLRTGLSPRKLLEHMNYKQLLCFMPTSKEIHLLVMYAKSFDECDLLWNLLFLRGSQIQNQLPKHQLNNLTPEFVKWVGKDISRVERFLGKNWMQHIECISELKESDYFGNPSPETLRRRLDARFEERRLNFERTYHELAEEKRKKDEALLAAEFQIPYPDGEYVKPIRNGQELKSWAQFQNNCIFSQYYSLTEGSRKDTFFVKITRSKQGATAQLKKGTLQILEIESFNNKTAEECDKIELEKWRSAIISGEISKIKSEKKAEPALKY